MPDGTHSTLLSFAETPLAEISAKATELAARGWVFDEERKGDPWIALVSKRFPVPAPGDGESEDGESELRAVMGDFWVDLDPAEIDAVN